MFDFMQQLVEVHVQHLTLHRLPSLAHAQLSALALNVVEYILRSLQLTCPLASTLSEIAMRVKLHGKAKWQESVF